METSPSRIAEVLVAAFLPADRREDVLGDLHQRYSSRFGYWKDAFGVVPVLIVSHLRRESVRRAGGLSRRATNGWTAVKTVAIGGLVHFASILETLSLLAWLAVRVHRWSLLEAMVSSWAVAAWQTTASAEGLAPSGTSLSKRSDAGE